MTQRRAFFEDFEVARELHPLGRTVTAPPILFSLLTFNRPDSYRRHYASQRNSIALVNSPSYSRCNCPFVTDVRTREPRLGHVRFGAVSRRYYTRNRGIERARIGSRPTWAWLSPHHRVQQTNGVWNPPAIPRVQRGQGPSSVPLALNMVVRHHCALIFHWFAFVLA